MTDKELRRLRRSDLLEMLIELEKENKALTEEKEVLLKKVADRKILISNSGSIAEAALQLNGIFEAAQKAADLYLENIKGTGLELKESEFHLQKELPESDSGETA